MTLKEALNFNVPIPQYCKFVKEAWEITNEEEKKETKKREDVFNDRLNIVSQFQNKIYEGAGELIDYCMPLIGTNKSMMIDDYFSEMSEATTNELLYREKDGPWMSCYKLFRSCYDKVLFYEENEREGHSKYVLNGQTVFKETTVNGETISSVEASPINPNFALLVYCKYKEAYEYRLCHSLCEYINNKLKNGERVKGLLASLLLTVCLYIALENEKEKIKFFTNIFAPKSAQTPQITPAPQAKRTKPVKIPHELNTPEGRKLLRKVIKAGYCDKYYNWDDTKWKPGRSRLALSCFAYRASAYLNLSTKTNKEGEPTTNWQPFETLFTYQGKEEGKNRLMQTKRDYMKTKTSFNPEEMDAINKLFR